MVAIIKQQLARVSYNRAWPFLNSQLRLLIKSAEKIGSSDIVWITK